MFKRLDQVECRTLVSSVPYDITQPGSYYLSTNLVLTSGVYAIRIQTNSVTLDLNGFALINETTNATGVQASNATRNVTIRNGNLQGWQEGICGGQRYCRYEDLNFGSCTKAIRVADASVVRRCTVAGDGSLGFDGGSDCLVLDSVVEVHPPIYYVPVGCEFKDRNIIFDCTLAGPDLHLGGWRVARNSIIEGCQSYGSDVYGNSYAFATGADSIVQDCDGYDSSGIRVADRALDLTPAFGCKEIFSVGERTSSSTGVAWKDGSLRGSAVFRWH